MLTQQVHQCEFCSDKFKSRPQVKNPRACPDKACQRKRQRSNELDWRQRHAAQFDTLYHKIQKQARMKLLRAITKDISRCLHTGALFLKKVLSQDVFEKVLLQFLVDVGIRKVSKFWTLSIS